MSYWEMDDGFLGHHKTRKALRSGAESLQLWCALRTYTAIHLTDGFVPDEEIDDLLGAPSSPRKWLQVLVECGRTLLGGGRGAGLVDHCEGGWMLHDYLDHAEPAAEIIRRKKAAAKRKQDWKSKHSQQAGTEEETRSGTDLERVPNASQNASGTLPNTNTNTNTNAPPIPMPNDLQQQQQPRQDSRRERSRTDLSELPINEIATRWRENPTWVAESSPQSRPELVAAARAWDEAVGLAPRVLGHPGRDGGTRALLELYADGVTHADVLRACAQAKHDDWICGRAPGRPGDAPRKRRIDCLSQAVLRRLLDAADEQGPKTLSPGWAKALAAVDAVMAGGSK